MCPSCRESSHQGKGYAKTILAEFIRRASDKGYDYVTGHFRTGASIALIQKFGGTVKRVIRNWEGSGEDFALCELELKKHQKV